MPTKKSTDMPASDLASTEPADITIVESPTQIQKLEDAQQFAIALFQSVRPATFYIAGGSLFATLFALEFIHHILFWVSLVGGTGSVALGLVKQKNEKSDLA